MTKSVMIGLLENRVKANQAGLLSLFHAAGFVTEKDKIVSLADLYRMSKVSYDDFVGAIALLFPEYNKANASDMAIYKGVLDYEKDTSERMNELGLGSENGSKKYNAETVVYNDLSENHLTLSYRTVIKYTLLAIATGVVAWLFYRYYKKL